MHMRSGRGCTDAKNRVGEEKITKDIINSHNDNKEKKGMR